MLETRLLSSLHRVLPGACPEAVVKDLSGLRNEPISFQLAFRLAGGARSALVYPRVECALPISIYLTGYVPVLHTDAGIDGVPTLPPGTMIGDMLLPKQLNPEIVYKAAPWGARRFECGERILVNAADDAWQTLWFTVNEDAATIAAGSYDIHIKMHDSLTGDTVSDDTLHISVINACLPPQKLIYTNWFHCDCLADFYGEKPFSPRFWEIMKGQVSAAARNGMNMILTPCFTPPLDTPIGDERMTVQLVKVTRAGDGYEFDFSLLDEFIDVCLSQGIEYFEHSHLFSQWGAKTAPKIVATVGNKEIRIFGWDTPADGPEYSGFLRAYIPALKEHLAVKGLLQRFLFHISDEPTPENADTYKKALDVVGNMLDGCMCGDALSDYGFYEKGYVKLPIVVTSRAHEFVGKCEHFWAYYTGGQINKGLSNRILVMPPERNRIMGLQLYASGAEGFLHWGCNFYYDMLSQGLFDPAVNPCGYNNNAGTAYCMYPARDGSTIQSVRQKVFAEGILDMRALELMESLLGRDACMALIRTHFGDMDFFTAPDTPEQLLSFREALNKTIGNAMAK